MFCQSLFLRTSTRRLAFPPRNPTALGRRRQYATDASTPPPPPPPPSQSRIERFNKRLPKFLHKYTKALGNAPVTHVTSFLVLHELTAVMPLLGLAATFHYTQWVPAALTEGAWLAAGIQRFSRYFQRKGWIRSEDADEAQAAAHAQGKETGRAGQSRGVRLVVEFAAAYAIVKMLLVPRIVFSVWAAPAFARWTVAPVMRWVRRVVGKSSGSAGKKSG